MRSTEDVLTIGAIRTRSKSALWKKRMTLSPALSFDKHKLRTNLHNVEIKYSNQYGKEHDSIAQKSIASKDL